MSAIATSTLLVVVIVVLVLAAWWRGVLKALAICFIFLTTVGAVEVVATILDGVSPN